MIIQSRKEIGRRFGKYKRHEQTTAVRNDPGSLGIYVAAAYLPSIGCPADSSPWYSLAFGMDGRRVLLRLDHAEAKALRDELNGHLENNTLRRVK